MTARRPVTRRRPTFYTRFPDISLRLEHTRTHPFTSIDPVTTIIDSVFLFLLISHAQRILLSNKNTPNERVDVNEPSLTSTCVIVIVVLFDDMNNAASFFIHGVFIVFNT